MPVTEEFREATEATIAGVRQIRTKAMFGGISIYTDELIFAIIDDDRLWFKADESNQVDYEIEGSEQWRPMPTAPPMGYFELPSRVLADPIELEVWIEKSLAVARRKAAAKKPKTKK